MCAFPLGEPIEPNIHNTDTNVGTGIGRYQWNEIDTSNFYINIVLAYIHLNKKKKVAVLALGDTHPVSIPNLPVLQ